MLRGLAPRGDRFSAGVDFSRCIRFSWNNIPNILHRDGPHSERFHSCLILLASATDTPRRIDAIDRKILRVLQEDASLSVAEIGERVGLSSPPCWKRIQRLEGEGIITGKVALVDQDRIGLGLSVFVSVESGDHSDGWLKMFAAAVSAMPEVMEFYRMAGDLDYMLRVVVADMRSYDIFYKKLIGAVALKNVTSRFAMEKIKSVTALPVPAFEAA